MAPFITVVIVNYNAGDCLARCLEALRRQTFRDFAVIIVDNGSKDHSLRAIESLSSGWRAIRLARNFGFAAANNFAVSLVESPWVATLNPDAYAEPDWLAQMACGIEHYPDAAAFGSVQIDAAHPDRLDGTGDVYHVTGVFWRGGFGRALADQRGEGDVMSVCAAAALYRREAFSALGGFDEDFFCYGEDVDLGIRLRLAGHRSIQLANAVVRHVGGACGGRRSDFAVYHGVRNRLWLLVKDIPSPQLWLLLPVHALVTILLAVRALALGEIATFGRGLAHACRGLAGAWRKRRAIQARRQGTPWSLLCWSPLAVLQRRPLVRPTGMSVALKPVDGPGGVGVIMVSYHTGPVLLSAIDAVLAEPLVERLVLVDNGNPPQLRKALARRSAGEPRLRLVQGQGNIGFAAGCNLAARHIDSDYLLLLNPDCMLPTGALWLLRSELKRRARPALLGAVMVDEQGRLQRATRRHLPSLANLLGEALGMDRFVTGWPRIEIEGPLPAETVPVPAISGAAMFLARRHYWALGGLDSAYFLHVEDLDFCARFCQAGGEVCLVPQVKIHHLRSSSNASRFFVEWHKTRGFRRYFRKQGLGAIRRAMLEAALASRLVLVFIAALFAPGSRTRPRGSGSGFGGS